MHADGRRLKRKKNGPFARTCNHHKNRFWQSAGTAMETLTDAMDRVAMPGAAEVAADVLI